MAKLKIAGLWVGVVDVELENWTVPMLREEIAKRSNMGPESVNLICAGRVLKDGDGSEKLAQLGVKNNSKILASRASLDEGKALKEELVANEERTRRLSRLMTAVIALANRRADGSSPIEDFNVELEDQNGQTLHFSETDRQAILMGLLLHTNGKRLIRKQKYKDALEVLTMGEEAFSLCNPKSIELVDNIPILQIDMVWCYFMLQDIAWLSDAGLRIEKAREGLERAHGKDSSRFRLLQAGRSSDLALYLRLELLEGVVAFHTGQHDKCRKFLASAQAKFFQLQVPDEALSIVMNMGFREKDAKRALRMSDQYVEGAIDFLVEERAKKEQKLKDDNRQRHRIMELKRYGLTPSKKVVDFQKLNELVSMGFEKELAAEALRRNENDADKSLDDLANPEANATIQHDIESRKSKRQRLAADLAVERLVERGFERSRVVEALRSGGSMQEVMQLLTQPITDPTNAGGNDATIAPATANNHASGSALATNNDTSNPDLPIASDVLESLCSDTLSIEDDAGAPSTIENEPRDAEMENEIAEELARTDAFTDYEFDVTKVGEAINEYLALLDSACSSGKASSST